MNKNNALLFSVLVVALMAGCAGSREAADAPHPLAGAWAYTIDTPQGTFAGTITVAERDDMLTGTIASDQQPDQTVALEELTFDSETSKMHFKYDSGEYGVMIVDMTLQEDALAGLMTLTQFNAEVPIKASRKME